MEITQPVNKEAVSTTFVYIYVKARRLSSGHYMYIGRLYNSIPKVGGKFLSSFL